MAATMMACAHGADTERAFLAALEKTAGFFKTAHHLELIDADGGLLLRFEARYLE
jgi:heat shock protein HslJ